MPVETLHVGPIESSGGSAGARSGVENPSQSSESGQFVTNFVAIPLAESDTHRPLSPVRPLTATGTCNFETALRYLLLIVECPRRDPWKTNLPVLPARGPDFKKFFFV